MLDRFARSIPTEVELADWPNGSFPLASCDALVVVLPKPLAGFGTDRQLRCLVEGLIAADVDLHYVGGAIADGPEPLRRPLASIEPTTGVPATYAACARALTEAFEQLADRGSHNPLVLSMGYTAFGPAGTRQAWRATQARGIVTTSVVLVDSAFPDGMSDETTPSGGPATRFHSAEYRSEPGFDTYFALTSAYAYDPRVLQARLPQVRGVQVVAPPYHDAYIADLEASVQRGRELGRGALASLPQLATLDVSDLVIPIVSSDIWSPSAVGTWMREPEYESVVTGTTSILVALAQVAERRGCRIIVPVDDSLVGAGLAQDLSVLTNVHRPTGLSILPYRNLSQAEHTALLATSDLAIGRTGGQANAFAVCAVAETPTLVVDLPAAGYMQAEMTSSFVTDSVVIDTKGRIERTPSASPLGYLGHWDDKPSDLAQLIDEALDDPEGAQARARAARAAFKALREGPESDLFALVGRALTAAQG